MRTSLRRSADANIETEAVGVVDESGLKGKWSRLVSLWWKTKKKACAMSIYSHTFAPSVESYG